MYIVFVRFEGETVGIGYRVKNDILTHENGVQWAISCRVINSIEPSSGYQSSQSFNPPNADSDSSQNSTKDSPKVKRRKTISPSKMATEKLDHAINDFAYYAL